MRERVYRLGRGPRQHQGVEFGVSQAARTAKSQVNKGVLLWKLRYSKVPLVFSHCHRVQEGRMDMSERVYKLGRGLR